MRRPQIPRLRRPVKLAPQRDRHIDPAEAAEWEAIVRDPIAPDARPADSWAPTSAPVAESLTPAAGAAGVALPLPNDLSSTGPVTPTSAPAQAPTELTRHAATDHSQHHLRQLAGETAPDFLLRTPSGVSPIADDFFDGLIRRVEGDR